VRAAPAVSLRFSWA